MINKHRFISYFISIVFSLSNVYAQETRKAGQTTASEEGSSGLLLSKEPCPQNLKRWIDDDFKQMDNLKEIAKEQNDKICQTKLNELSQESEKNKATIDANKSQKLKSTNPQNVEYSRNVSQKYKGSISNYENTLKGCSSLSPEKEKIALTRFYNSSEKLTNVNEQLLGDISFYDSYLPPGSPLASTECPLYQPGIVKKCDQIRKESEGCKATQEARFNKLVAKTHKNISKITELKKAYKECYMAKVTDPKSKEANGRTLKQSTIESIESECGRINAAITILEAQTPWIKGSKFQDMALSKKANPRTNELEKYKEGSAIKDAIYEQLNADRQALRDTYDKNLQHIRCMTFNSQDSGQECDFGEIRRDVNAYGNLKLGEKDAKQDQQNSQLKSSLDADQCLMNYGQKRQEVLDKRYGALKTAGEVSLLVATTFATDGMAAVAWLSRARKAGQVMELGAEAGEAGRLGSAVQRSSKILQAGNVTEVVQGINSIESMYGLSKIANACHNDNPYNRSNTTESKVDTKMLCQDPKLEEALNQEQSSEYESDCAVGALLGGLMQLPFMASVGYVQKLNKLKKVNNEELKALLKKGDRADIEKFLSKNAKLTDDERKEVAQALVKRNLTDKEASCIMDSHNVGAGKSMKISSGDTHSYNFSDFTSKGDILRKCGFSLDEVTILMRSGVTGTSREELSKLAANVAGQKFGRQISDSDGRILTENTSALLAGDTKAAAKARENLKAAGFSDSEIDYIQSTKAQFNKPYDPSAAKATEAQLAAQKASAEKAAQEKLAAQKLADQAAANDAAKKAAAQKSADAQAGQNPFLTSPTTQVVSKEDFAYRVANGARPTDTEARMYLSQQAKARGLSAAAPADKFKTVNAIVDDTLSSINQAKQALNSGKLNPRNAEAVKQNLAMLKTKCQGLPQFAELAGFNGAGFQSDLKSKINKACD